MFVEINNGNGKAGGAVIMAKRGYSKEEAKRRRRNFRVMFGLIDFFGTVAGFLMIIVCVVVIATLLSWFSADIQQVFTSLLSPLIQSIEGTIA